MSLDKGIQHGKEQRKQYRGAKACDKTCRNHGSCGYCRNNRLFNGKKRLAKVMEAQEVGCFTEELEREVKQNG